MASGNRVNRDKLMMTAKYVGTVIVGATTLAVSAVWLTQLARQVGFSAWLAPTLPVTVDVGGGVATLVWITSTGVTRTWGRAVAIGSLLASIVGNTISHLLAAGIMQVDAALVVGVGAMYPIMFWLMIHMLVLAPGDRADRSADSSSPPAPPEPVTPTEGSVDELADEASVPASVVPIENAPSRAAAHGHVANTIIQEWVQAQVAHRLHGTPQPSLREINRRAGAGGYAHKIITSEWITETGDDLVTAALASGATEPTLL